MDSLPPQSRTRKRIFLVKSCTECQSEFVSQSTRCAACIRKRRAATQRLRKHKRTPERKAIDAEHRRVKDQIQARRYYAENRERRKAAYRQQYAANPTKKIKATKAYYQKHEAKMMAVKREWRQANKPRLAEYMRRRKAKRLGATIGNIEEIREFYEMVRSVVSISCYWCKKLIPKGKRTVDHIYPIIKGGAHAILNLCCACDSCNKGKMAKLPEDFAGGQMEMFLLKA